MKQFTLFLVLIALADISFALPVTRNEDKVEEKPEELGNDLEVNL